MTFDREKIADKIKKLLAKAKSVGEAEAASFAAKAQELLAQHNIDISEVEKAGEDKGDKVTRDDSHKTKVRPRYRNLRNWCARMYFCEYYFIRQGGSDINVYVGAPHNIEVTKMMAEYLQKTIWRLAVEHGKSIPSRERTKYQDTFADACSARLVERMKERIEETRKQQTITSTGSNLPALASLYDVSRKRNRGYMAELGIKLKTAKRISKRINPDGYMDGRAAGNTISLDRQVGTGNNHRRLQ